MVVDIASYALERAVRLLWQGRSILSLAVIDQAHKKMRTLTILINVSLFSIQLYVFHGSEVVFTQEEIVSGQVSVDGMFLAIKRLLQCFFATNQKQTIDEFIIAGEYAELASLQILLEKHTNFTVLIANPLSSFSAHPSLSQESLLANSSSLMLACGLALRELPGR
jgi:Tfp pilus assembly PilM family ATPase